jgi:hypothetical protein
MKDAPEMATIYNEYMEAIDGGKWAAGKWIVETIEAEREDYYNSNCKVAAVAKFIKNIAYHAQQMPSTPRHYGHIYNLFRNDYATVDGNGRPIPHTVYWDCAKTEHRGDPVTKGFAVGWLELKLQHGWNISELRSYIAAVRAVNNKIADPALADKISVDGKPRTETLIRTEMAKVVERDVDKRRITFEFDSADVDALLLGMQTVVTAVLADVVEAEV